MSQAAFVIGRFDWVKNRGGSDDSRLRTSKAGRSIGNVRGLPQVVFKVVGGGGCKGVKGLAAQLDYVLGKADQIIDPNKELDRLDHLPAEFSKAIAEDWAEGWTRRVEAGHSMHMIASFPIGTDPAKVAEIMRATCYDVFDQGKSRFNYIAAVHTDKGHPHAHIIVDRRNAEGEWFYFARNGEFTYDRVKDTIVEHAAAWGVELVNSSKLSRGITRETSYERGGHPATKGLSGELKDFGFAPYQNDPKNRETFYVTIEASFGVKTVWGKEIAGVIADANAQIGEKVCLTHQGKEAVTVTDRNGREINTHRNQWQLEVPARGVTVGTNMVKQASEAEVKSYEWQRANMADHAQDYRAVATAYESNFPALSRALGAAADALENGKELFVEIMGRGSRVAASGHSVTVGEGAQSFQMRDVVAFDGTSNGHEHVAIYAGDDVSEVVMTLGVDTAVNRAAAEKMLSDANFREALAREYPEAEGYFTADGYNPAFDRHEGRAIEVVLAGQDRATATVLGDADSKARFVSEAYQPLAAYEAAVRPPELTNSEDPLAVAVRAEVQQLNREGYSAAYISERSFEIEDRARADLGLPSLEQEREIEQMATESSRAMAMIQESRDTLSEVRETIPDLLPEDRPAVEARYFEAVRDLDRLTTGHSHADYTDPARGTIYADGSREAISAMSRADLEKSLEGTGIDPAEVAARAQVENRSAALEAHWVAMDANSIAQQRGYDMSTEEGARQAYSDLAATYRDVGQERTEELAIPVITGDGERLELTEAEIRERAALDPALRLENPADGENLEVTDDNIAALRDYHQQEQLNDEIDYDAAGDPDYQGGQAEAQFARMDDRDLVEVVEQREALLAEARDLASRDSLTTEQQDRLTHIVEQVSGKEAAHDLRAGNVDGLKEAFPDHAQRLNVAERYLEAEQNHGLDRDDALSAVRLERENLTLNEAISRDQEAQQIAESIRERSRDNDREL